MCVIDFKNTNQMTFYNRLTGLYTSTLWACSRVFPLIDTEVFIDVLVLDMATYFRSVNSVALANSHRKRRSVAIVTKKGIANSSIVSQGSFLRPIYVVLGEISMDEGV